MLYALTATAAEFTLADVACRTKLQQPVTSCLDAEGYIHSKHAACKQKEGPNDTRLYLIHVTPVTFKLAQSVLRNGATKWSVIYQAIL